MTLDVASTRKVLYRIPTSSYSSAEERNPDIGDVFRKAREILYGLPELVVMGTRNRIKYDLYGSSLDELGTYRYTTLLDLVGLEDLQSWLTKGKSVTLIPEAEEPYSTARENARAKLVEYIKFIYGIFGRWVYSKPGLVFAVDDDFSITTGDFTSVDTTIPREFQPGGAIKSVNGSRTSDPRVIADKYCRAVKSFGVKRDLSRYGLSGERQSLPVLFEYNLVAGVLDTDTSREDRLKVNIYSHQLQIPGYLLPFSYDLYFDGYPVVWIPAVDGIDGRSMGECVKLACLSDWRQRDFSGTNLVLDSNFGALRELACDGDSSRWNNEGTIEIDKG